MLNSAGKKKHCIIASALSPMLVSRSKHMYEWVPRLADPHLAKSTLPSESYLLVRVDAGCRRRVFAEFVIKLDDTDAALMLTAASDATSGDFPIKVTGRAASSGADFSKELKLPVAQQ